MYVARCVVILSAIIATCDVAKFGLGPHVFGATTSSVTVTSPALLLPASTTVTKDFAFGPGTTFDHSEYRTFDVPPKTTVGVAVKLNTDGGVQVPVYIEVHQASSGSTGADGPLLDVKPAVAPQSQVTFTNTYSSNFGCPNTWGVRVTTQSGKAPPVKVSGTIIFTAEVPDASDITISGGAFDSTPTAATTVSLSAITANSSGVFRIKAKWHTDPLDLLHLNQYFQLRVALLRPDGSTAASFDGFSIHAPSDKTPKLDFSYNRTAQDATQSGGWKIRVTNISSVKIVSFNVEKGSDLNPLVPAFHSTFAPKCF